MVTIKSDEISFAHLTNLYQNGAAGVGIQVVDGINEEAASVMCTRICKAVIEYSDNQRSD
jgi:hypothetical protein